MHVRNKMVEHHQNIELGYIESNMVLMLCSGVSCTSFLLSQLLKMDMSEKSERK